MTTPKSGRKMLKFII